MKRIVAPVTWSMRNRVEHPPLMTKQLLQSVCGGLRWLEAKNLAEFIAAKAIEDGFPSTKKQQKALAARPLPRKSSGPKRRSKLRRAGSLSPSAASSKQTTHSLTSSPLPLPSSSSSKELTPSSSLMKTDASDLIPLSKPKRLVQYDVLDCTFGTGFHTGVILENGRPYTRVVAMDCDAASTTAARDIVEEFGEDRFRFYVAPMSDAKTMFGERSFDAVIIDPGPSMSQLEDPERGFLLEEESTHAMDMRYGPQRGVGALQFLNTVPQHALSNMLASYKLLSPGQAMKLARAVRKGRPFSGSTQVLEVVEAAGNDLPEEGWLSQDSRRKSPMSWKFLTSLRCIINDERTELSEGLQSALLMLRNDGRLVVFTRLPWEEEMVQDCIEAHPHALLCYSEVIEMEDVQEHGHTRHTKMWVATRTAKSAFVLKNTQTLTEEKVRESSVRWMGGLYAGQTYGFPANNFTFENLENKERRTMRRNTQPPPFDWGDDDR